MKFPTTFVLLATLVGVTTALQHVLPPKQGMFDISIEALIEKFDDPVDVIKAWDPSLTHELDEPRLLEVLDDGILIWMTEGDKLRLKRNKRSFIDLTNFSNIERKASLTPSTATYQHASSIPHLFCHFVGWPDIRHEDIVKLVISRLNINNLKSIITALTSFWTRYYKSEHGRESSRWLYNQVLDIIAKAPSSPALSVEKFTHPFPQSSIIARFEPPSGRNASAPVFIIGAHQDSANYLFPLLRAPGADDDGHGLLLTFLIRFFFYLYWLPSSGTATILEAFRALVETGFNPKYPVEFHWYAGEEGGLLGSQAIVKDYLAKNINVGAMLQFDMTAYVKNDTTPTFTLISTDVDTSLTNYIENLAKKYIDEPVRQDRFKKRGGSDHMSWQRAGYPAAFATEGPPLEDGFNPYVHTPQDRMDIPEYSCEHALESSKVAVAFAIELGGWVD